jgi:UDP-glucose 4-epimerase
VLVTGVSNPLGAEVARRLASQVPYLFGCDVVDPVTAIEEMDFVHADTRLSVIGKLVRQLRIDTVVHLAVTVDSPRDERAIHETDVIGTMNVLVGSSAPSSPVRRLVVKSSAAVYGAAPTDPSFFSEDMTNWDRPASGVTRDLLEMEQLVSEFALRNERCDVTVLRLGFRVSEGTSLARYLSLPIVPAFAGFDPRLQLLHEDDAAESIVRATLARHVGTFNVAGDGVILLSQAIAIMGGRPLPVLSPYGKCWRGSASSSSPASTCRPTSRTCSPTAS